MSMKLLERVHRVRQITLDMRPGEVGGPRPGDLLRSPKSYYRVLKSHQVNRRDKAAPGRFRMQVKKIEPRHLEREVRIIHFEWYARKRKTLHLGQ